MLFTNIIIASNINSNLSSFQNLFVGDVTAAQDDRCHSFLNQFKLQNGADELYVCILDALCVFNVGFLIEKNLLWKNHSNASL